MTDKRPVGRPTVMTEDIRQTVCDAIAQGMTIRELCKGENMPSPATVYLTLSRDENFSEQYVRAKAAQAELMADEMLEIADDGSNDYMERRNEDGSTDGATVLNGEHVQRSRLRVDTRKWLMSKMLPKKYGDKQQVEHSGSIGVDERLERARERVTDSD